MLRGAMRVCIAGIMGSGKSHFGPKLAQAMGYDFKDLDALIVEQEGRSISSIFELEGEPYFRKVESQLLEEALRRDYLVLSLGGGTPCFGENLEKIKELSTMIWLNLPPSVIAQRLSQNKRTRPLIAHCNTVEEIEQTISRILEKRQSIYGQADLVITDPNAEPDAIAREIHQLKFPPDTY